MFVSPGCKARTFVSGTSVHTLKARRLHAGLTTRAPHRRVPLARPYADA